MRTESTILRHPDPEAVLLFLHARLSSIDMHADDRQCNPRDDALRTLRARLSDIVGRDNLVASATDPTTVTLISELRSERALPGMMARISKTIHGPASLLGDQESSSSGSVRLRIVRGSMIEPGDPPSAVHSFLMRFTHSSDPVLDDGIAHATSNRHLPHTSLYE